MSLSEEPETKGGNLSTERKRVQVERAGSPVPSCLSMRSGESMDKVLNFRGELPGDSRVQVERAGSPVPSCLSMRSGESMDKVLNFRGELPGDSRVQVERPGSPEPSFLSVRSGESMDKVLNFRGELPGDSRVQVDRAGPPVPSCLSMRSGESMDNVLNFRGELPGDSRVQVERAGSSVPSCVSLKSDDSMEPPLKIRREFTGDQRVQIERAASPVPSCLSMKSDHSMNAPILFRGDVTGNQRVQIERAASPVPSCLSMKSDHSMNAPILFRGDVTGDQRVQVERAGSPVPSCLSMRSGKSMDKVLNFRGELPGDSRVQQSLESSSFEEKSSEKLSFPNQSLLRTLMNLKKDKKLKLFQSHLSQDCPECFQSLPEDPSALVKFMKMKELFKSHQIADYPECTEREQEDPEALYIVEKMLETCGSERSLKITLHILKNMKQKDLADSLERDEQHNESIKRAQQALKMNLKKKFECIFECSAKQGNPTLFNEIYTELYITEGGSGGGNNEHEVRQIETASKRQTTQETAILCNDIFKPLPGQKKPIRTVLTKGIAGIGKTVSVQKFILDWAEGKANQNVDFIFTLPFRDLNLKKQRAFSLMQLLQHYFPQLKQIKSVEGDEVKIKSVEGDQVKVLFIFDGLDECRLPLNFQSNEDCCDVTESSSVDVLLTNLIKGNLLPSALLWITSRPAAANQVPPECVHQVTEVRGFNDPQKEEYFRKRIRDQNQASRIISHIKSSRSLYIMCHIPVFCWISFCVLETMLGKVFNRKMPKTLTEMYTHFLLIQTNVKNQKYRGTDETDPKEMSASDTEIILKLGQLAFLQLEKGNLIFYEEDLKESGIDVSEASVYSGVCTEVFKEECGLYQEKVYCFVHLSIQEYLAALFVFHSCVNENRNVLRAEESKPHSGRVQLSELLRSAVDQALRSKNGHLDLFLRFLLGLSLDSTETLLRELLTQTGSRSDGGIHNFLSFLFTTLTFFQRLWTWTGTTSPVPDPRTQTESRSQSTEKTVQYIKKRIREESSAERTISLFHCLNELNDNSLVEEIQNSLRSGKLSDKKLEPDQCSALAFVLLMSEEILDEFDLKTYNTSAAGHQRLLPVIRSCRKAKLNSCDLTVKSCNIVASALQSPNSPLTDLGLSYNNLRDSGVELLCAGLMSPNCQLQRLDLSYNKLGDSGVKLLCAGLMSPNCKLQRLGLNSCGLTVKSCDIVASALQSSNSPLKDLDLSYNNLGDSGVELLCAGLMSPNCKLQRLGLNYCKLTQKCCNIVASALQSSNSPLRDLDLSYNNLGDSGLGLLCAGLRSPNCKLQRLGLGWCNLTEGCCDVLASVLRSPHSELRDLELRDNELQDSGVRALSAGLEDPHFKLQRLGLSGCRVKQRGCDSLASALCSNPSHLRELDLRYNHPGGSGVRALSAAKLDTLTLLVDHGGENRTKPGPRKYGFQFTLDPNTPNRELSLSEGNRKVTHTPGREEPYPDQPERFEYWRQVVCRQSVCERCYWEAEFSVYERGWVYIAVTDKGISRKGWESVFGGNKNSWSLRCCKRSDSDKLSYSVCHNKNPTDISALTSPYRRAGVCVYRVGVCVDRPAGILSFYSVSDSDTLTLLHRLHTRFTEHTPLCAGFYVWRSSVSLC
ncbi:NACHT, LRR and PYD domains-containing protein 12-like isoform X4 [Anguilla rostrata]|uniref:NACHT, LRR and PYD domains-containing protein 12-like isoform X4 n=1 Tax=Anguilla rostrata TaxID=7938 RepID=UPI0030CD9FD8